MTAPKNGAKGVSSKNTVYSLLHKKILFFGETGEFFGEASSCFLYNLNPSIHFSGLRLILTRSNNFDQNSYAIIYFLHFSSSSIYIQVLDLEDPRSLTSNFACSNTTTVATLSDRSLSSRCRGASVGLSGSGSGWGSSGWSTLSSVGILVTSADGLGALWAWNEREVSKWFLEVSKWTWEK